jgi:hypothetical protein
MVNLRQLTRDLKSQSKTYTFRNKKRSNEMVESWIASLPTYTVYKGCDNDNHNAAAAFGGSKNNVGKLSSSSSSGATTTTEVPASEGQEQQRQEEEEDLGATKKQQHSKNHSKHEAFSKLSVVIPETFTNIQKDEEVIELKEEEACYFAGYHNHSSRFSKQLQKGMMNMRMTKRTTATAAGAEEGPDTLLQRAGAGAGDLSLSLSSFWQNCNSRLDIVCNNIRNKFCQLPASSAAAARCYSIRTQSVNGIRTDQDDLISSLSGGGGDCRNERDLRHRKLSNGDDVVDSEDPDDSRQQMTMTPEECSSKKEEECHPSITKMSFHSNVPNSVLTFTICAFQFTQSSGLLLSFAYLFML